MSKIVRILLISISLATLIQCNEKEKAYIPYTPVNIEINLNDPEFSVLQSPTGHITVPNAGYNGNGIIVYATSDTDIPGELDYKAYDMTCTYNLKNNCSIEFDSASMVQAVCPCCSSAFELHYGTVIKSPAEIPLTEYHTTHDDNYLYINN
jgi:Rieske Fe-S protein